MRLFAALLAASFLYAGDSFLFTSFRGNGETGVYFSLSSDGRQWSTLNGDKAWIPPQQPGMLMRDPWLGQGPDGTWHLLWTWGWTDLRIGYSDSKDLITWTPQREIRVFQNEPTARNAWAPEAVWDKSHNEWIVFWSTTIPGRFPDTENTGDTGYNHRVYASTTKDWMTFTPAKLWFDPGFNSIDATVVQDAKRWVMIFKDERKTPLQKRLRVAFADSPAGPWRDVSEPFSPAWVEGPTVVRMKGEWWIYYDHYTKPQHYGAMRTRDWKTFEEIADGLKFPEGQRHGTVVRIPEALARKLRARNAR